MAIIYYPRDKRLVERTTSNGGYTQIVLDVYPNTVVMFDSASHAITEVGTLEATSSWAEKSITASYALNGGGTGTTSNVTGSVTLLYVTSLQNITAQTGSLVTCAHYSTIGDGGGGTYYLASAIPSPFTVENELVIESSTAGRYWIRVDYNKEFPANAVGCKADDSTDNSALLGNAMLLAQKLTASLLLGKGIYKVGSTINSTTYGAIGSTKTFDNLKMYGLGQGVSIIESSFANTNPIFQFSGAAESTNCEFKNFTLTGDSRGFGLYCSASGLTIDGLEINTNRGGIIGYSNYPINYLTIKNNWIHDILYATSSAVDLHNQAIMVITGSARNLHTVYDNNLVENISAFGLVCKGTRYARVTDNVVRNWGIEDSSYAYGPPHGIYFSEGDEEFYCNNNTLIHTASKALYAGIHCYDHRPTWTTPSPNKIRTGTISNNKIIGCGEGIIIYGCKNIDCHGNIIKDPPVHGILGVGIGDTCEDIYVHDNIIDMSTATSSYGVTFGMSLSSLRYQDNIQINNNSFIGCKKGAVAFGSSNWTINNNDIQVVTGSAASMYSIYLKSNEASYGIIDGNQIYNVGSGSNPMGGINCGTQRGIVIKNNVLRNLRTTAIKYNSSTGVMHNNIAINNTGSAYDSSSIGSFVNNISI